MYQVLKYNLTFFLTNEYINFIMNRINQYMYSHIFTKPLPMVFIIDFQINTHLQIDNFSITIFSDNDKNN